MCFNNIQEGLTEMNLLLKRETFGINIFLNREMSKLYIMCSLGCTLPFAAFCLLVSLHCSLHREVALKLLKRREMVSCRIAERVAGGCKPFYR